MPKNKLNGAFGKMMRSYDRSVTRFALVGDNEGNIIVGGQTGFIYVRVDGMKNEVLSVFNSAIPLNSLVVGLPVWIQSNIVHNYDWQVVGGVHDDLNSTSTTGANINGDTITVTNNMIGAANNNSGMVSQIVPAGTRLTILTNHSLVIARTLTVDGDLINNGDIVLVG